LMFYIVLEIIFPQGKAPLHEEKYPVPFAQ